MRRFFIILFLISAIATGTIYYWRTYQPEETVVAAAPASPEAESADERSLHSFSTESVSPRAAPVVTREPSQRQDLAMIVSVVSSIVSALAAIFQTFLAAKAVRSRA